MSADALPVARSPVRIAITAAPRGHTIRALAIAKALERTGVPVEIHFLASELLDSEARLREHGARNIHVIAEFGRLERFFFDPLKALRCLVQSTRILSRIRPAVLIGTGASTSVIPCLVARVLRIPLAVVQTTSSLERTSRAPVAELANRVVLPFADLALLYDPEQLEWFTRGRPRRRARVVGPILDPDLPLQEPIDLRALGLRPGVPTVLFNFGSTGDARLAGMVVEIHCRGLLPGPNLILIDRSAPTTVPLSTGGRDDSRMATSQWVNALRDYIRAADVVVSRPGQTTMEIAYLGRPMLLIPEPKATKETYVRRLEQAGLARVILNGDVSPEKLAAAIADLLGDAIARGSMKAKCAEFFPKGAPLGSALAAEAILEQAGASPATATRAGDIPK